MIATRRFVAARCRSISYTRGLMVDEEEERRLNIQHRGWKATNGGKNYVAPMDKVLNNCGEGTRIIDIGTGMNYIYNVGF
jgi:hypothetical protein